MPESPLIRIGQPEPSLTALESLFQWRTRPHLARGYPGLTKHGGKLIRHQVGRATDIEGLGQSVGRGAKV